MNWLKSLLPRWPWYYWIGAAVLPGGLVIAWIANRRKAASASRNVEINSATVSKVTRDSTAQKSAQDLVDAAKVTADTYKAGLAGNPLAAQLIGIPAGLIDSPDPAVAADNAAKAKDITLQIAQLQTEAANAQAQYPVNHFGGQSQEEFTQYLSGIQGKIQALETQLSALGA